MGHSIGAPAPRRTAGFTLIELAVVMLLLVIVLAMVGINYAPNDESAVHTEADRLSLLLQSAQQEAMLRGVVLALNVGANGYRFEARDAKNAFQPLTHDDILRPRKLPPTMSAALNVNGGPAPHGRVVLSPSGELTPFQVVFTQGDAHWKVEGGAGGDIKSSGAK